MQKIRLVAIKSAARPLIAELHRLGMVEMRRFKSEGFESGKALQIYDDLSSHYVRVRTLKSMLGLGGEGTPDMEMSLEKTLSEAESLHIEEDIREKHSFLEKYSNEMSQLRGRLADVELLQGFSMDFSKFQSEHLSFVTGTIPLAKLPTLQRALKGVQTDFRIAGRNAVVVIAYPVEDASVELTLSKQGFALMDTSGFTVPSKTKDGMLARLAELKKEAARLRGEIARMAEEHGDRVRRLEYSLSLWAERALIAKEMGFGVQTFILEGWIKAGDADSLAQTLETKFGSKVFLEAIAPGKDEPPVVLDNPTSTHPFQFLVELFSLPKASEIDPTLVLLITVPIIYGMMLGDVFYGLVSFLLAGWVLKKMPQGGLGYGVASIWKFSAIAGIIFGIAFDEWLGMSSFQFLQLFEQWGFINLAAMGITGPLYAGFSRTHQVSLLIGISILMGLAHLALGFFLGAVNEWHHNRKHAIGKIAWIFIELGGLLAVTTFMFNVFPEPVGLLGAGILVASIIVMALTEGMVGLIELPGLLGNILSYARIAAVGLVGVLLAALINDSFIPTPDQPLFTAIIMVPLLLLFHVLNIGLTMVECIVQGGRLNLVEFYSKFFHGGGKQFTPFAINNVKK